MEADSSNFHTLYGFPFTHLGEPYGGNGSTLFGVLQTQQAQASLLKLDPEAGSCDLILPWDPALGYHTLWPFRWTWYRLLLPQDRRISPCC